MCEALDIIEKRGERGGERRGEKRVEKHGVIKTLSDLVRDGILSISEAAKRADMTVADFLKKSRIGKNII